MNIKANVIWDRVLITSLSVSFGLALFLMQDVYGNLKADITHLQEAKAEAFVEITRIKTTQENQYHEIIRLLTDLKEEIRR